MLLMLIDGGELMLCAAPSRCYTLWPLRSKAKSQPGPKPAPLRTRSVRRASDSVVCWACSAVWRCKSSGQPDGGDCVKKTRKRHVVRKMKDGPSEPPCRRRLQTALSCYGPKAAVVKVRVKRRGVRSRQVGIREMSANEPLRKHRKQVSRRQNRDLHLVPGTAWKVPTYWSCGVRCLGGMTLIRAFVRNLRTGSVMIREKAQVETPRGRKYRCSDQGRTAS